MIFLAGDPTPIIQGAQTANYLVTIGLALASGTGGWSVLQFILNRTGRKAEAARLVAQVEQSRSDVEESEARRRQILNEFQVKAQEIAVQSATAAYERVQGEAEGCRHELRDLRRATETLIRAVEDVVFHLVISETDTHRLRVAISMARDSL